MYVIHEVEFFLLMYIEAAGKRIHIRVPLDSGSNIFVINKDLVEYFDIPYETRQKRLNILAFDGEVNTSEGKHFTHPYYLTLEKIATTLISFVKLHQQENMTSSSRLEGGIRNILYRTSTTQKNGFSGPTVV